MNNRVKPSDFEHHEARALVVSWKPERTERGFSLGWYQSRHGLVRVTIHPVGNQKANENGITALKMNHGGVEHHRIWRCIWPAAEINGLAHDFADHVADRTRDRALVIDRMHRDVLGPITVEPTEEMCVAGAVALFDGVETGGEWNVDHARLCWRAMIDAARGEEE